MKYYLAARYSRRQELLGYADRLRSKGHEVTNRWLSGANETLDKMQVTYAQPDMMRKWAREDLDDIYAADVLVYFTDNEPGGRGGAAVEFGYALNHPFMTTTVVGKFTNIFTTLADASFKTVEDFFDDVATFEIEGAK